MRLRRTVTNHSSKLGRALGLLLVSTVLIVSFVASSPSLSKYVLESIGTDITFLSGSLGTPLESIGSIIGTTRQYETLTAGNVAPQGATYTLQWQRANTLGGTFIDIPGATSQTYYLDIENNNHYIRVSAIGTGDYTGTVYSNSAGPVVVAATPITEIGSITGSPYVAQTISAGALTPVGATATYQWKIADSISGTYSDLNGATGTSLALTEAMLDKYIRIYATGSNTYSGTVYATLGPIRSDKTPITAIGSISGTTQVGQTLTVGTITPVAATVSYQWQRSDSTGSIFSNILGAISSTYVTTNDDLNLYVRVVATGTGSYTGTVTSSRSGPVVSIGTPLTDIGNLTGIAQVGSTLTAGALSPTGATATFQWWVADAIGGPWSIINGATNSNYLLTATNFGKYVKVIATGAGSFTGSEESNVVGPILSVALTSIGNISGSAVENQTVTAGTVLPTGATVTYQWRRYTMGNYDPASVSYSIIGSNSATYTLGAADVGYPIRVAAIGTNAYSGSVLSQYIVPVSASTTLVYVTSIADSIGLTQVFQTLTAGTVSPYGATVTYQWYRSDAMEGSYSPVGGATSKTIELTGADKGYFFKVVASGSGSYAGSAVSRYAGPITGSPLISIANISGTATTGQVLTAGSITPSGATVTYQWLRSDINGENYTAIAGATSDTYGVIAADEGKYIKVQVTGTNLYMGTVVSNYSGPVLITPTPITFLDPIVGQPQVGQVLQTGNTTPLGATVTYQWLRALTSGGAYTPIPGATLASYTPTVDDLGQYMKVTVWGAGIYSTPANGLTSPAFGPISTRPLSAISNIIGKAEIGQVFTAGTVTPIGATVNYQWQSSLDGITYTNITGATSNTYTITNTDNNKRIRVQAIGTGGYTGTVISNSNGPIGSPNAIQLITDPTGITQVGYTLTAGTVIPYGATVTYQWLRSDTIDGTYAAISGATNPTYVLTSSDQNKYLKVIATGFGLYFGEVISDPTDLVAKGVITNLGPISGQMVKNQTISTGVITPTGATVTYQWQRSSDGINYSNIAGATLSSYQLSAADVGNTIKLVITGTGAYEGTVTSPASGTVMNTAGSLITITSMSVTTGSATVGQPFAAGTVSPSGSIYTLQWQRSSDNVNYVDIPGATSSTYMLTAQDFNQYVRPKAVGYDTHTGTVFPTGRLITGRQVITAIGEIQGTAALDEIIRAGAITPLGATVSYQWLVYTGFREPDIGTYTAISGATDYYYKIPTSGTPGISNYIKLQISGTGAYTGTVTSVFFGPLTQNPSRITAISPIVGNPRVNNILTSGTVTPYGASVTYQWFRKPAGADTYSEIPGATASTYRLVAQDYNTNLKVVVTGAGGYYGWVESEPTSLVQSGILTSLSPISGSTSVGQTLSAGSTQPVDATVNYQWLRSDGVGGFEPIYGATQANYALVAEDTSKYIKVQVTGYGAYSGTILSAQTGPVVSTAPTAISGIITIGGTIRVNSTINATGVSPPGATVTYQWMHAETPGGTYHPIAGAVASTYVLSPDDYMQYIKVQVTGSGAYTGTLTSAATGAVAACPIVASGPYTPATQQRVNQSVIAFAITPSDATVTYKWEIDQGSKWDDIGITTSSALIPFYSQSNNGTNGTVGQKIRVTITGTGAYSGTIVGYNTNVTILAAINLTPITAISPVIGTSAVGQTLTAGNVTPVGATVNYQWQRSLSSSGTYENVSGATASTYIIQSGDLGYYFRVMITGTGSYTGVLNSVSTGPVIGSGETIPLVSISDILYTTVPDLTLTAGSVSPLGATVTYQWLRSDTTNPSGGYTAIPGATSNVYTIPVNQALGYYFKLVVNGSGSYSGSVTSNYTGPVVATPTSLISVALSGTIQVGETLSAVSLNPVGATVTYQWQVFTGVGGVFADIPGANSSSYTLQPNQYNYYIRVIATGSGAYTGSVYADTPTVVVGLISSAQLTMASPTLGTMPQTAAQIQTLTSHPDYSVTGITWNEVLTSEGKFKAGATYSATLTLTSKNMKTFVPSVFTPIVPSATSVGNTTTTGTGVGNTVNFTVTFAPTGALLPTSISVSTQPTKMIYTESTDGTLALNGMVVTETNNDGTITTTTFTDGTATGYTTSPANGSALAGAQNNTPVVVTHTASGKTANTANLTVEAAPSASNVVMNGTAAVGSTLTGSYTYNDVNGDLQGTPTYRWLADGIAIDGATSNSYILTAAEAGKNVQFEVTPVALTGTLTGEPVLSTATQDVANTALGTAAITMTAPVLGATPESAASVETSTSSSDFTVSALTWNETLTTAGMFKAGISYSATITLTSKNATTFQASAFTPTVATANSVGTTTTTGLGIGNTVTFTVTFSQTGALEVTGLTVQTQPTKLSYVEMTNDTLSLNGLILTVTHNDGSSTQVTFTDGAAVGFTASPAHGTTLTYALHNGLPITITHTASSETATTNNLAVQAQVAPVASGVSISGTAQVGQTLTGSYTYTDANGDLEVSSSYQWYKNDGSGAVLIDGATSITYVVQAADVGKVIIFKVTPVSATGVSPGLTEESSPTTAVIL